MLKTVLFSSRLTQCYFYKSASLSTFGRKLLNVPKLQSPVKILARCCSQEIKSSPSIKPVGYWLLACSGMVFVAVSLGGITRLTESGLSMVSWKLMGEKLPLSNDEWLIEFEKYKQYPEFKIKNQRITLEEFKWIWWMEYGHRMWGRLIGGVFLIPATIFWYQKRLSPPMKRKIIIMGSLIAAQGLMGWYMVKSGLEDKFDGPNDVPRVSQYRLAAHLTLAFILYMMFFRSGLDLILPVQEWSVLENSIKRFKILTHSNKGLIFLTAISGALVAGLDAGLVYSSFPKMGDKYIPDDILQLTPKIKNLTENPTTVMFNHRVLGIITFTSICSSWALSRRLNLPSRAKMAVNALLFMSLTQVGLGITTVLTYVPVPLAAAHQCGSLLLLSIIVWLTNELKYIKKLPKI